MTVYGGSGGKRTERECCETGSRWDVRVRHCRRCVYETGPRSEEDLPYHAIQSGKDGTDRSRWTS